MNLLNLERYLIVTTLVMAAAMLLARMLPMPDAKVRLRYLYLVLILCLVAPLCFLQQQRIGALVAPLQLPVINSAGMDLSYPPQSAYEMIRSRVGTVPLLILAIGLLRVLWLCAGLVRLSLYRRRAEPILPLPDHLRGLLNRQRVDASLFVSSEVSGPVTFGLISSTVLLPADFSKLDEAQQNAIVCHELVHVRRNDAVKAFCEEVLRSLLWFHPCVWWLLDRIQLCREQVVDAETIAVTEDRETYLETLLVFAKRTAIPDLAPATAFLKKHHLRERVKSITTEVNVTAFSRRVTAFAMYTAVPCLLALAIWRLPLQATPQVVPDTPGVTVWTPYTLQHRGPVELGAVPQGVVGELIVAVKLNESGEVVQSRVVSGPAELAPGVLRSVATWHFRSPAATPREFDVRVAYDPAGAQKTTMVGGTTTTVTLAGWDQPLTIRKIDVSELPESLQKDVLAHLTVREGAVIKAANPLELSRIVAANNPLVGLRLKNEGGAVEVTYLLQGSSSAGAPPAAPQVFEVGRIDSGELDEGTRQRVLGILGVAEGSKMTLDEFTKKSKVVRETTGVNVMLLGDAKNSGQVGLRIRAGRPDVIGVSPVEPAKLTQIDASGLPEPLRQQVLDQFGFRVGEMVTSQQVLRTMPALMAIDGHVTFSLFSTGVNALAVRFQLSPNPAPIGGIVGGVPGGVTGGVVGGVISTVPASTMPPVYTVAPEYPPLARQARIQGTIRFSVIVAADGTVQNIQLISGHPLLIPAATEAVKQYRFQPPSTATRTQVDVNFTLSQ